MAKKKSSFIEIIDSFPLIVKIILALPFFDSIVYGIYRIAKGKVLLGVIWLFLGCLGLGSIIDIVSLLIYDGKIKILA